MKRSLLNASSSLAFVGVVFAACSGASSNGSTPLDSGIPNDSGFGSPDSAPDATSCGGAGEMCCTGSTCGSGLFCDETVCAPNCGDPGEACCNGTLCSLGLECRNATCTAPMTPDSGADAGPVCPTGTTCGACTSGGTTSISGKVYDPAGKFPLYDVTVYVPVGAVQALPRGLPTGAAACSCDALYSGGVFVSTKTAVDGSFSLKGVPSGTAVPLVVQTGKWRRVSSVAVQACQDNPQPDKSLALPATLKQAGDSMPDIAVSTGGADTLECLFARMGLPTSEFVAGTSMAGHVHLFAGGDMTSGSKAGGPEPNPLPGTPASSTTLWDTPAHLAPFDILALSCEGGETYAANPPALEQYLGAGGRVLASHYHYAWFTNPLESGQSYTAPVEWGANLATWTVGSNSSGSSTNKIVQTLNGSMAPFPKGVAFDAWLSAQGALGVGAPAGELGITPPRFNAVVSAANKPSQAWLTDDATSNTMLFTFDAPVDVDGGPQGTCGRVAFTDMHVSGNQLDPGPPPSGCVARALSPQELALEFMLFDLSSCVIPDTQAP